MNIYKDLSPLTIALGLYIVVSASFMLQVNNLLTALVGDPFLITCFRTVAILLAAEILVYAFVSRVRIIKICAIVLIFCLAYYVAKTQRYYAERTHILTYGFLGYMAARDLVSSVKKSKYKNAIAALLFVTLISASDEGFQYMLPYRFGEFVDFAINVISGAFGISLYLLLNKGKAGGA